jgi:hypothetical protein
MGKNNSPNRESYTHEKKRDGSDKSPAHRGKHIRAACLYTLWAGLESLTPKKKYQDFR